VRHYAADVDLDATWRAQAACRGCDPALWYPEVGDSDTAAEAKAVCAACPVADACLDYALAAGEKHGVWGGLSEKERRPLRRQVRRGDRWRRPCKVHGCNDAVRTRALCRRHYMRWWRLQRTKAAV
jgi:WhiB family transcriptional regulator, redox-sensing transcriptional regulator